MRLRRLVEFLRRGRAASRPLCVLVATCPEVRDSIATVLSGCPVHYACDMGEGLRALQATRYTHVVVGYLFAESHMFEFARQVRKAQPDARVLCVKAVGRRLSQSSRSGFHEAALALGCQGFFDITPGDLPEAMLRSTFEEVVAQFGPARDKPREAAVVEELHSAMRELRADRLAT